MSLEAGFDTQTPSLPSGGGAVDGLGETFTTDLSTGTGSFGVRLDVPNGPNDMAPHLVLRYDTGQGNGPFGLGFALSFPRIVRTTARGYPEYGPGAGGLTLEGAGDILVDGDVHRLRVDGGLWRIERDGEGFRLTDRNGLLYFLGPDADSRLSGTDASGRAAVYAWHLRRIEDALGNAVVFDWIRDGAQLYLARVAYGAYEVRFFHEPRPDPVHWGRAGFVVLTALRCARVELHLATEASSLVRRWALAYSQAPGNGVSLLSSVTMTGFDGGGAALEAPVLRLTYSAPRARELVRFSSIDEGAAPGPFAARAHRTELLDWEGRGLPDLVEIGRGGRARRWPNLGDCTWGRPMGIGDLPALGDPTAAIGFIDFDGNGAADLVRVDQPLGGYVPREPGAPFGRPVAWPQAPRIAPDVPGARLIDLDGDGRVDLMVGRGDSLLLYYRDDERGWDVRPQVVSRGEAPTVNLADPHILLGDMTGDGAVDMVRVDSGGVTWWPYLGGGRWGEPIAMAGAPELGFDLEPSRLFLTDVDGDGCADLVYVHEGRVRYWINQSGRRFGGEQVIDYVPTGRIDQLRLADMRGTGTAGLLWCQPGPLGQGTEYFYLDFTGGSKPYLLTGVDNGVGLRTHIEYTTSALEVARAEAEGRPSATPLPLVIPIVAALVTEDATSGPVSTTRYRYFSGRWDGVLREFAGFGRVEMDDVGDETQPTLRTTTWFHNGGHPESGAEPRTSAERHRWRALRGRIRRRERSGPDGGPSAAFPYDLFEQAWIVAEDDLAGQAVYLPRLRATIETAFERDPASPAVVTNTNVAWDAVGNIVETLETATSTADPAPRALRTRVDYAASPSGRFPSKPSRTRQFDGLGALVADAITEYDGLPEGQVGAQGLITRRRALALPDAMAASAYGAPLPDFAALGYQRVAGSAGWWVTMASYERTDDGGGLRGRITGPRGAVTEIAFDPLKQFPVRFASPLGHVVTARYDPRLARAVELTDAAGAVQRSRFDPLARLTAWIAPGDSDAFPSATFEHTTNTQPASVVETRRAVAGTAAVTRSRRFFDGGGRVIEQRGSDEAGEIIHASHLFGPRGWPSRVFREMRAAGGGYTPPSPAVPHVSIVYDAVGRVVRTADPEGRVSTTTYGPGFVEAADQEDTRSGPEAPHAGTVTRRRLDASGRIAAVEQRIGARTLTSTYEYDVKGNLLRQRDPLGRTSTMVYDLFGRLLKVIRPEQTAVTVYDAGGNAVETRTGARRVMREFDLRDRPLAERQDDEATPGVRFTYHDPGRPAPPDAGTNTRGRLARVDDQGGVSVFDYDARGRLTTRTWTPAGGGAPLRSDVEYRTDGQIARVQYPDGGAGRQSVNHSYNARGLLSSISSAVDAITYDLGGRPTGISYANGVVWKAVYDVQGRIASASLTRGATVLWSATYELDGVGNLLRIGSPDPLTAAAYVYDDLYRLVEATLGAGEHFTYRYDDACNLTHKSDVGDYVYGEGGAPATCVTSAGAGRYTYTEAGEIASAPWGTHRYDALGRLLGVVAPAGPVQFTYDYAGRRVRAQSAGSDILTPDPLFSIEQGALVLQLGDFARLLPNGQRRFVHRDHLGSVVRVTDDVGVVVESRRYDPYGAVLAETGSGTPPGFGTGTPEALTGLVYLGSRYYHPSLGRFISADSLVAAVYDPAAWAAYTYCRGNPTSFVDPDGHDFWRIFVVVLAVIALVALTIFTAGASTALATAIIIGMAAGGVVGGITAARVKGHDGWDVVAGVLVGAAVGGYGALAGGALFPVVTHAVSGWAGGLLAGGLSGAINGGAMGFAAGFAAEDQFDTILWRMAEGAVLGLVTGAVLGALGGGVKTGAVEEPKAGESIGAGLEKDAGTYQRGTGAAENAEVAEGKFPAPGEAGMPAKGGSAGTLATPKALPSTTANAAKAGLYGAGKAGQIIWVHTIVADTHAGTWNVLRGWAVTPDEIKKWIKDQVLEPLDISL